MNKPSRGGFPWLAAGYAGLAGFFALEALRRPGQSASLAASGNDRGTTRLIIACYAAAADLPLLAGCLAGRRPGRRMPAGAAAAGLATQAAGLGLRAWSMRTLGRSYTRTLRVSQDSQTVVESGPYRVVRHPGYLGSLLIWAGFALTSRRPLVIALVPALIGAAYGRRISAEERLLRRDLPGYVAYSQRTKKLIPLLW